MEFLNLSLIKVFIFVFPRLNGQGAHTTIHMLFNLLLLSQLSPYGSGPASYPRMIKQICYSFKTFRRFRVASISWLILQNQLALTKFRRVHNRGSQIPLSRLFFFSIPPSRPILRPNPEAVPFFFCEIFCLIIEIEYIRLTFQQLSVLMVKVLNITISDRNFIFCFAYFSARASVHVVTSIF